MISAVEVALCDKLSAAEAEIQWLRRTLRSDRFLDAVLDELTERAGHPRNTDVLGLARWDLKAAIGEALDLCR